MAGKILGKFASLLGFEGEDDYEQEGADPRDRPDERGYAPSEPSRSAARPSRVSTSPGGYAQPSPRRSEPSAQSGSVARRRMEDTPVVVNPPPARRREESRLYNMSQRTVTARMVVYQPQSYEETQRIIDDMKAGRAVIVNFESLSADVAQRLLDFISGAVYSLDGTMRKISRGIFVVAPPGMDISGNVMSGVPQDTGSRGYFNLPRRPE